MEFPPGHDRPIIRRRLVASGRHEQVSVTNSPHSILATIRPVNPSVDLKYWIRVNREYMETILLDRGAILFRGFQLCGLEDFLEVVMAWSAQLVSYTYGSTPRHHSAVEGVYTSTEYPADQSILMHNEMSYARNWPRHLWFYCDKESTEGGSTPLADSHRVGVRLNRRIFDTFLERGVRYERNYGTGFDLSWQQAFETASRADVESLCHAQGIELSWSGEDDLRTSQVCHSVIDHPKTGARVWFNQAHLFHVSALPAEIRKELRNNSPEMPRQVFYGDGGPIEDSILDEVRAAYAEEAIREPWKAGDALLIDNMLVAHGRDPYRGTRRIFVAMTDEYNGYAEGTP
jgi:alpha-ketoglutarate-dependent taurine dioxygenase